MCNCAGISFLAKISGSVAAYFSYDLLQLTPHRDHGFGLYLGRHSPMLEHFIHVAGVDLGVQVLDELFVSGLEIKT